MARARCAFCRRQPVDAAWRPFCSERCKLQDLARWLDGEYRIADDPVGDSDESTDAEARSPKPES